MTKTDSAGLHRPYPWELEDPAPRQDVLQLLMLRGMRANVLIGRACPQTR